MSGSRMVFDGLWRCLCPSVDAHVASRLLSSPALPRPKRPTKQHFSHVDTRHHVLRTQCRRYGGGPASSAIPSSENGHGIGGNLTPRDGLAEADRRYNEPSADIEPDPSAALRVAPVSAIYEALEVLRGQQRSFKKVARILTHLVTARDIELTPVLYEHLATAMADVQGSAAMLAQLFAEMRQLQLTPSPAICHAALAALAIHPDYLVRNEVLMAMKQSWTEVSIEGESHIALGLLRDGQYELALDKLEAMIDNHVPIDPWVYDIFIFMFAQRGFVEEAVKLAHSKAHASEGETYLAMWYMLLDVCSHAYHYEGTRYIWGRLLETDKYNLSDGVLLNIINTAARHHDFELVTNANRLIAQRGGKLLAHHYEPLIDCYGGIGDLEGALRVLCIMFNAISVAPYASTRSIYEWIKKQPESLDSALEALKSLMKDYKVPIAALNVLIEAAVETQGYAKALQIYKDSRKYTEAPPNHVTIRYLLQSCKNPEHLQALVAEDPELAIKGDRKVFAQVVFEHVISGDLNLAYKCVKLLGEAPESENGLQPEVWINQRTLLALVRKSLDVQDERVWWLVEQAEKRNMDVHSGIAKLMASFAEEIKRTTGLKQEDGALDGESEPRHPSTS
ncbi:pentatricopeptide repeat protein [Colletotrichum truncatum]|uniref:Pentatricopeptide repeat protein n=1 Tax=Colletotrichum truncatum TaxID=5467 RepID=A0ACC3YN24_COLTU|nr:pentatricopeptide repeat protein [Colletotrichum truncatum]KAF6789614.1 pentatricopeptide repeat protein [Colletotrichum truncatum]